MIHSRRKPSVLLLLGWNDTENLETIGDYAREHDWQLEMRPYFTGALPGNWQGDGILYSKGTQQHIDELVIQQATRCPIVALNANLPPGKSMAYIQAHIGRPLTSVMTCARRWLIGFPFSQQ